MLRYQLLNLSMDKPVERRAAEAGEEMCRSPRYWFCSLNYDFFPSLYVFI